AAGPHGRLVEQRPVLEPLPGAAVAAATASGPGLAVVGDAAGGAVQGLGQPLLAPSAKPVRRQTLALERPGDQPLSLRAVAAAVETEAVDAGDGVAGARGQAVIEIERRHWRLPLAAVRDSRSCQRGSTALQSKASALRRAFSDNRAARPGSHSTR